MTVALTVTTALGASGCAFKKISYNTSKSQLFVKYYNGGVGREWIDDIINQFETEYAETSFEEGKKGVEVVKDFAKETLSVGKIKNNPNQVHICVNTNYYEFASNNVMLDITDVVKDKALTNKDVAESVTIESKISEDRKNFYNLGSNGEDKYYALPFFESSMNLVYNVDLFNTNNYYFAKNKSAEGITYNDLTSYEKIADLFITDSNEEKSYGPDGKTGTINGTDYSLDDGLPATYDDFQALLTYMKNDKTIPFIWSADTLSYLTCLANEIWANSEGKEKYAENFSFRGTAENLLELDANGNVCYNEDGSLKVKSETEITPETAYNLHLQKGKYDAIRFVKMMMESSYNPATGSNTYNYYKDSMTGSLKYTAAQDYFINAKDKEGTNNQGIGFIVEGTWWNNESKPQYKSEADRMNKKFAVLPLPKPDKSQIGENNTKISERESLMYISKYCEDYAVPIAKAFMKYLQSDRALNIFSSYTNMLRAMNYNLTDDTLSKMTYFGKQNYALARSANTDWIDWLPTSPETKKNKGLMDYLEWGFKTGNGSNPFSYFYDDPNNTVGSLFTTSYKYYKNTWAVTTVK